MAGRNDITGDKLINKVLTKEGEENWDKIFNKTKETIKEHNELFEMLKESEQQDKEWLNLKDVGNEILPEYELDKSTGEVVKVDVKKLTDAFNGH